MYTSLLLAVFYLTSEVLSSNLNLPCKSTDLDCIKESIITSRAKLLRGMPEFDIKSSDPFFFEKIEGNLPNLKYNFFDTTLSGYTNCVLSNLQINNNTNIHYDLDCPKLIVSGKYEMNGNFISSPVEGNGDFEVITGKYFVHVEYELKKYQGKDGKYHLGVQNIAVKCVPKGPLKFDFKNLVNGRKDLSDAVLKSANENWREVAELIQDPIWYACITDYLSNMNKLLEQLPLEHFIVY